MHHAATCTLVEGRPKYALLLDLQQRAGIPQQELVGLLAAVLPQPAQGLLDSLAMQGILAAHRVPGLSSAPPAIFGRPCSPPTEVRSMWVRPIPLPCWL